ncbi:MAG: type III pantothenate kinase [Kiritimatiellae bacterium]|nr:type III pantothenate kinase [Kiritimatiellia bacterium]
MRVLVADVGNTSTAVGLWSDGRVSCVKHFDGAGDAAIAAASRLAPKAERFAYVSVVPAADRAWAEFSARAGFDFKPVSHRDFTRRVGGASIVLDYPNPATIGADRLADAAGAVSRYGAPVLVMDFGTALTAAVVTGDRVWRGGVIAPGFPLMRDYLFERAAKLPRMKIGAGRAPKIGRSTAGAMRFGALVGYRGMVREIAAQLRRNFRCDFKLVATGGFAGWVLKDLDLPFTIDPTLTLHGAGLICANRR